MTTANPDALARETAAYAIEQAQKAWPETNGPLLNMVTEAILAYGRSQRQAGAEQMRRTTELWLAAEIEKLDRSCFQSDATRAANYRDARRNLRALPLPAEDKEVGDV